jgi:transposase
MEVGMPQEGLSMRNVREILRLRLGVGLSSRQVAKSCKVSSSTVLEYEKRARDAGLSWPLPDGMDDAALERIVRARLAVTRDDRPLPDVGYLVQEMRRPHVTLSLLWLEYKAATPDGYQYTQFCHYYSQEKKKLDVVLRQEHRAGEKLFTDYAGDTINIINSSTGEITPAYIFVAVLGASNYTYAEAVADLTLPSWISSHIRALEFFGGAPEIIVPDNTKCAVIKPDRYEPDLNPAFAGMAAHYSTAIIPARVAKPRDKAKVEAGVQLVERWILAALRNRQFFSVAEVNAAIDELLERLNNRKFKRLPATRLELFEKLDKPALRLLPPTRYEFLEWRTAKVGIDYHISAAKHLYSVPYQLSGAQVDVRLSSVTVEILYKNRRVASHLRSYVEGGFTTNPDHRPKSHQAHLEWTPSRIISWAERTGPSTAALVQRILESRPHPEMGYRSCLGVIRLSKEYGRDRVEAAAIRALSANVTSYKSLKNILDNGLDKVQGKATATLTLPLHSNIRGVDYYN